MIEGAGSEGQVFLTSCADLSAREGFALDTGELLLEAAPLVIPATVTMIRAAEGWVLSGYLRNEELVCP